MTEDGPAFIATITGRGHSTLVRQGFYSIACKKKPPTIITHRIKSMETKEDGTFYFLIIASLF